ncbi:MAG: hypothetical protein M3143_11920, partial [Actinomycetota bacterium]|nr:hypothetical protein [Actinomycetota bacterium]
LKRCSWCWRPAGRPAGRLRAIGRRTARGGYALHRAHGAMAELRARIAEQAPQGTVVTIYAIDGMAGVGKTAFARHAAHELATRYPLPGRGDLG